MGIHLLRRIEDVRVTESLSAEDFQALAKLARLIADYVRAEIAVRPGLIPVLAESLREVEDDGEGGLEIAEEILET